MDQETTPGNPFSNLLLGITGAVAGGVVGHFAFLWIMKQGFYALALPGALSGLGCGLLVRQRSVPLAAICGLLALALGIFSEWRLRPFVADGRFTYFLSHLLDLQPLTWIMIALGAFCGFWFALGRKRKSSRPEDA